MQPRLNIGFSCINQYAFWFGKAYSAKQGEYLLNHARSGIVMALRAALPQGGRVGVVAYNCYTVANAVVQAGCHPVFVDVIEDLHIDMAQLANLDIDALILTNLFGIRNDVNAIRQVIGDIPIIVDNAHGVGLPNECDFTVYSINQGKFPALGEGGILVVNNQQYVASINQQYEQLPIYTKLQEAKLFLTMLLKALLHTPIIYKLLTMRLKARRTIGNCCKTTPLKKMAIGICRIYNATLPTIEKQIAQQRCNVQSIKTLLTSQNGVQSVWAGENAFMLIVRCQNPKALKQYFASKGIEIATHFANAIVWAKQFGYQEGTCPMAEQLTKELLMIPTYKK